MRKQYLFYTTCVDSDAESIHEMTAQARAVTLATFRRNCNCQQWEEGLGYERHRYGLPISRDWAVSFYKSKYRGRRCYYAVHSAIEHIFVKAEGR